MYWAGPTLATQRWGGWTSVGDMMWTEKRTPRRVLHKGCGSHSCDVKTESPCPSWFGPTRLDHVTWYRPLSVRPSLKFKIQITELNVRLGAQISAHALWLGRGSQWRICIWNLRSSVQLPNIQSFTSPRSYPSLYKWWCENLTKTAAYWCGVNDCVNGIATILKLKVARGRMRSQ